MAKDKKEERLYDAEPEVAEPEEIVDAEPSAAVPAVPDKYARQYIPEEEMPMPRLRIIQKDSEEHPAGVFVNTQTEETFAEIECIILGLRRGRVRWDPSLKNMEAPLCRSRDAMTGVGEPGGSCVTCPDAVWNEDAKPPCAIVYDFIGLDGTGAPFLFSVSRTGIKPARNFIAAAQRRKKPLYHTGCTITLRKETKPAPYYVPVFKPVGETNVETWPELEGVLQQIEGALDRVPVESTAANDAPAADY